MKQIFFFTLLSLTVSCCCQNNNNKDIVKQSHIHQYGVAITKNDWIKRGSDGKVISLMKDGITVTKTYNNGVLNGETTYSFPYKDSVEKAEYYDNGTLVKKVSNYNTETPMKEIAFLPDNTEHITLWYNNGSPKSIESYDNNIIITGEYFTTLNNRESSITEGNGIATRRDANGQIISRDTIEDGAMVLSTTYYRNGEPLAETPYSNNIINGEKKTFLLGGEPDTIENWIDGSQEGITVIFQNGEKYAEISYENGQKNGIERRFKDEYTVVENISWKDDKKHGPTHHYVADQVKTDWYYQNRSIASKSTFEELSSRT